MAQLRQDYARFVEREAEVIVVGPDSARALEQYWAKNAMPMVGCADPTHTVAKRYGQQVSWLKLGRMPSLMVIDKGGRVRFVHYASNMRDYPENSELLAVLDELERESREEREAA